MRSGRRNNNDSFSHREACPHISFDIYSLLDPLKERLNNFIFKCGFVFFIFICLQHSRTAWFANVYVENFESPLQIRFLSRSEVSACAKAPPSPLRWRTCLQGGWRLRISDRRLSRPIPKQFPKKCG